MSVADTLKELEKQLKEIEEQLGKGEPRYETFRKAYEEIWKLSRFFEKLLELAKRQSQEEEEEKFRMLHSELVGQNASVLAKRLNKKGFILGEDEILGDAFSNQVYRILELVRAGKRGEVYYSILRIFISAEKPFPADLAEAFRPAYSNELFKIFLFSFLSGVLERKSREAEQQEEENYGE